MEVAIHVLQESLLIESHGVKGEGELSEACIELIKMSVGGPVKLINRTGERVKTSFHHVVVLFGEPEANNNDYKSEHYIYDTKVVNQPVSEISIKPSHLLIKVNLSNTRGFVKISANFF